MIPSVDDLRSQWQQALDFCLETGETPVIDLGSAPEVLVGAPGLMAMDWLEAERRDSVGALAVGGGSSSLWLASLFHLRPDDTPDRSPAVVTAYSGADDATHRASLTVWDTRRSPFDARPSGLPPALQPDFLPDRCGAPFWSTLPVTLGTQPGGRARDGWTAWFAVVTALILLLIAFVA